MTALERFNLTLRAAMELGIVAALGYWGYRAGGDSLALKTAFAIGAPLLGFGVWGSVDFRRAGQFAEPLRLCEELLISGLAALALYATGQHLLGLGLATLSIVYHALLYASGGRLLKRH